MAAHIALGETVIFGIKLGRRGPGHVQRIELRRHVSADAIISDELMNPLLKNRVRRFFSGRAISTQLRLTHN